VLCRNDIRCRIRSIGSSVRLGSTYRTFVILVSAAVLVVHGQAQTTTSGSLSGVVVDQSNAVIAGADVEIRDITKGTTQSTKTDREGVYQFLFLAPAKYTLTVSHANFREEQRTVDVLLGPAVSLNVALSIATPTTEITVGDEAPLLQAESGDFSTAINQDQI